MSLDIRLIGIDYFPYKGSGIFIRKNGQTIEISREEWDRLKPGVKPVVFKPEETNVLFRVNITSNLAPMADACDLYKPLWCPEEVPAIQAYELINPLIKGLQKMHKDKEELLKLNPPSSWGSYDTLSSVTSSYLEACITHLESTIEISK
jgi:hypothetical protein